MIPDSARTQSFGRDQPIGDEDWIMATSSGRDCLLLDLASVTPGGGTDPAPEALRHLWTFLRAGCATLLD